MSSGINPEAIAHQEFARLAAVCLRNCKPGMTILAHMDLSSSGLPIIEVARINGLLVEIIFKDRSQSGSDILSLFDNAIGAIFDYLQSKGFSFLVEIERPATDLILSKDEFVKLFKNVRFNEKVNYSTPQSYGILRSWNDVP